MKITPLRSRVGVRSGFTLLELTIVIMVVLMFLGMTFVGVTGWKRGADRAGCVLNIRHMQMAVRGYSNSNGLLPGENTTALSPPVSLAGELVGSGGFLPQSPVCPGNGSYTLGGDTIPQIGTLYMRCSLEGTQGHVPDDHGTW